MAIVDKYVTHYFTVSIGNKEKELRETDEGMVSAIEWKEWCYQKTDGTQPDTIATSKQSIHYCYSEKEEDVERKECLLTRELWTLSAISGMYVWPCFST